MRPRKNSFVLKKGTLRRTKAFSCTPVEWRVFEKMGAYAKSQGRSESKQIILVIQQFFAQKEMIDDLNNLASSEKSLHVCENHQGSEKQILENEKDKSIYTNYEKMNSLGGGLPARPQHTCYGMGADLSPNK